MLESYVQSRFLVYTSTVVSFQTVIFTFLEVDKNYSFIDILSLYSPKKIPIRFYISSVISDQTLIEVLVLR
jgi:hypothetical protein